jgi:uncharacterized membrane protein YdbT with pleckstrin-like domain
MGNYVDSHLIRGETVVYTAKLHWIIYLTAKAILTLGIGPFIQQATSEFAITTKRIIIKVGLVARRTLEMNLSKIETVNVDQSIMGRILDYGSITVIGTGGTQEVFHNIASPMQFRKAFQEIDIAPG